MTVEMVSTIAVAIASVGRREILPDLLANLAHQSRPPDKILLSVASPDDLPERLTQDFPSVEWVIGAKGSSVQRNTALDRLRTAYDLIAFLDDDYMPSRFAVERMLRFFAAQPHVVGANGELLADGARSAGISAAAARALVGGHDAGGGYSLDVERSLYGLYGCNMVYRASALEGVRFDERLKLYGWQEDIDFSARLLKRGVLVKTRAFAGVHLGVKQGRTSGLRLGYSQVVNPVYLAAKGTMRPRYAARIIARSVLANHLRAFHPEPWVDRAGRIKGNWLGLADCLRGRLTPERIETL